MKITLTHTPPEDELLAERTMVGNSVEYNVIMSKPTSESIPIDEPKHHSDPASLNGKTPCMDHSFSDKNDENLALPDAFVLAIKHGMVERRSNVAKTDENGTIIEATKLKNATSHPNMSVDVDGVSSLDHDPLANITSENTKNGAPKGEKGDKGDNGKDGSNHTSIEKDKKETVVSTNKSIHGSLHICCALGENMSISMDLSVTLPNGPMAHGKILAMGLHGGMVEFVLLAKTSGALLAKTGTNGVE